MIKDKVSIVIPSNREIFLSHTIQEVLEKAKGDIEVIAVLDGYYPVVEDQRFSENLELLKEHGSEKVQLDKVPLIIEDPRVVYLHLGSQVGMRECINRGVAVANGEYIMKLDAHCMVDEGFDEKLKADMQDDWVVVPARKRLNASDWKIKDVGKPDVEANYLSYPYAKPNEVGMHGNIWNEKAAEEKDKLLAEDISFQGSCWFIKKEFYEYLELEDKESYGEFANEAQEIGFKAFLSGGKVMRNKKTWYAHLHKGRKWQRGYFISKDVFQESMEQTLKWLDNRGWSNKGTSPKQKLPFSWLIERFMPMPTWPENWKEELAKHGHNPEIIPGR